MSNFRPRQCGLFIVILSSTLSLKTVVFFYPLLFLRLLSPRLKYSRLALCMNALPYAPYFRQRFAPFFRHRRRSQGYLKSRHSHHKKQSTQMCQLLFMVRVTGLEPVRRETHAPQTCLSAYSSTLAFIRFLSVSQLNNQDYIIRYSTCQHIFESFFNFLT